MTDDKAGVFSRQTVSEFADHGFESDTVAFVYDGDVDRAPNTVLEGNYSVRLGGGAAVRQRVRITDPSEELYFETNSVAGSGDPDGTFRASYRRVSYPRTSDPCTSFRHSWVYDDPQPDEWITLANLQLSDASQWTQATARRTTASFHLSDALDVQLVIENVGSGYLFLDNTRATSYGTPHA